MEQVVFWHISGHTKEEKETRKSAWFSKGNSCLINLIILHVKMSGFVDKGRIVDVFTLNFGRLSTLSPTIFSYSTYDIVVQMCGLVDG